MNAFKIFLAIAFVQVASANFPDYWSHDGMGTDITEINHEDIIKETIELPPHPHLPPPPPVSSGPLLPPPPPPCAKSEVVYEKPLIAEHTPCKEQQKVYLHRQPPIIVRPPPSKILVNHPPVIVKQPPVILHHHSRSPVIVKPVIIREKEVATKPVLFKVAQPKGKVWVSKCQKPEVQVSHTCNEGCNHHMPSYHTGPHGDLDF
ncbi:uncharacterized protein LOC129796464 [Lutzomyia longipalpis]|uniref:Putative secreted protein n=1 Tax=Lutzomyia longipalpis TaxID=7200 RepID=A0A1B0GHM7_LUTLO|nr:uncharacterized protein LOC129796464 [Lutzomyia longipalpis]